MIEIHSLPSADVKKGTLYKYIGTSSKVKDNGTSIPKLVFIEYEGLLETQRLGIRYKIQLSTTYIGVKPKANDLIKVEGLDYRIVSIIKENNPAFIPFWELEVKSVV